MKAMILGAALAGSAAAAQDRPGFTDTPVLPGGEWRVHDANRPHPDVVTPGATPGAAPSDAVVLFDGRSLDGWTAEKAAWTLGDGFFAVPPDGEGGSLVSKESFGDVQLHLEFRTPTPVEGTSQDRGNSGIWFMKRYEIQILDNYRNPTYADGTIGAIYAWKPPLVNAARAPGEWQTYDIVFQRPRFAADGSVERPAYATVFLNGVLVQNNQPILGSTVWRDVARYEAHGDAEPISLQDHGSAVAFRNIWARRLPEAALSNPLPEAAR